MVEDKFEVSKDPVVIDWYQEKAARTAAPLGREYGNLEEVHYSMGISTEAGEILDIYKKNLAYDKPIDNNHVKEEIGDLMWYVINLCRIKGFDFTQIIKDNIAKLEKRFPDKFSSESAINRDHSKENEILQKTNAED